MKKHVILGAGNLGLDLEIAIKAGHRKAQVFQAPWRWPASGLAEILALKPSHIWCAVGGGSVEWAEKRFGDAHAALVNLPSMLMRHAAPDTKIILFSTDYAASEAAPSDNTQTVYAPRSDYALLKSHMEDLAKEIRPSTTRVVRLGSLYGLHRPGKNLANKIRANAQAGVVSLAENLITPTPTDWIAKHLSAHCHVLFEHKAVVHHCAPHGSMSVMAFGDAILPSDISLLSTGLDPKRPPASNLCCSFLKTEDLAAVLATHKP